MLHDICPCRPSRAHIESDARVERLTGRLQAVTGFRACQQTVACVGTEHILLGLIREGEGVAAQVLVRLGADLNWVRQQVIQLLHGYQGKEQQTARARPRPGPSERRLLSEANASSALSTRVWPPSSSAWARDRTRATSTSRLSGSAGGMPWTGFGICQWPSSS